MWFNIKKNSATEYSAQTRKNTYRGSWQEVMTEIDKIVSVKYDRKVAWNEMIARREAKHAAQSAKPVTEEIKKDEK